jgi:hypothetical protein
MRKRVARTRKRVRPWSDPEEARRALDADRKAEYRKHRNMVGERMIRSVLRLLATVDAANTVNERLEDRYDLGDVRIDVPEVMSFAENILRVEVAEALTAGSTLTPRQRREFVERVLARLIPRRDNVATVGAAMARREPARVESIEAAMRREMKRFGIQPSRSASRGNGERQ